MNTLSPDPFRASPPLPSRQEVEQWMEQVWHEGTPVRISASDVHIAEEAAKWAFAVAHQYSGMKASPWYLLSEKQPAPNQWCEYQHHDYLSAGIYSDSLVGFWELGKGTFVACPYSVFWRPLSKPKANDTHD